ncbi:MAG: hypothetical protein ABJH68_21115 [Ilumatobacter sp.]|uniref:hypothetical protein n=1 Tax=Ilumatobacter sp. TaxID=1967498 RepID=UPI0032980440
MIHARVLFPVAALLIAVPACASDEAPPSEPQSTVAPETPELDDGIIDTEVDTNVETGGNAGFEGDEDG